MSARFELLKNKKVCAIALAGIIICLTAVMCKGPSNDDFTLVEKGFINPPQEAAPRVWWHWMNGNISQDGIRADLEWMNRVGIGGFQNFDAGLTSPQIVEKRLIYMTPEWKDAFRLATRLADSLNLEMAIAGSPGWSESGGPWVKPEEAMKKYVWSEIRIDGGKPFSGILPDPPKSTGAFQNLSMERRGSGPEAEESPAGPEFYADAAVVAFRVTDDDASLAELAPKVTSSGGKFSLDELTDGDLVRSALLPSAPAGKNAWIQFEFSNPQTIKSLTFAASGGGGGMFGRGAGSGSSTLEVSDDGRTFTKVADITAGRVAQNTMTFAPVTGKYFRFNVRTPEASPNPRNMGAMFGAGSARQPSVPAGTRVAELVLHTTARINRFEDKAGFAAATAVELERSATPEVKDAIMLANIIDLTSVMKPDGSLEWTPPEGKWVIMRLGYSLTGHQNSPASPEATGLEVDKLNPVYVKRYFDNYLDQYKDATGGLMGQRGLQYIITDSWEAGTQNWTDNMMTEFKNRRGYDMIQWLPVLSGHIVEGAGASDRFLWDFRRTLEELVAEYHYDQLTDILEERGMLGRYTESHEGGRAFIGDGMEVKRRSAVPMSATWTPGGFGGNEGGVATRFRADVRESASVAHLYGQKYVAAESLTAIGTAWAWSPELLKPVADMELASGLNRFVIHTSVHQPVNDKIPGLGLGPFGQWFNRHETWAEQAGAWITYLARSCYMLQQGKFIADVAYLYGEGNNITALFGQQLPKVPQGYEYDFVNADALLNVLKAEGSIITTPSGMNYKLLALDESTRQMTLPVLKKINEMVTAGAIVTGPKPETTPSLSDDQSEFTALVNALWPEGKGEKTTGMGKIYSGYTVKEVLDLQNIIPDFAYSKQNEDTEVLYVHRSLNKTDIYWVNNRKDRVEDIEAAFRIEGRIPEIWHPETGLIEEASYRIEGGVTLVTLHLEPADAVFVVFRNKAKQDSGTIEKPQEKLLAEIPAPWKVTFQEKRGAPAEASFEALSPWNENSDPGIKYFSGTGSYSKTINVPAEWLIENSEVWLDLGVVKNLAEVIVNGKSLGIVWKTPFRINVTGALKSGENNLEIKITNLWVNRLIGDQQPDVKEKLTYTTQAFYQAGSPLLPSGLMGPVKILGKTK
ncbi:MAG: glycosyl hydrolase [Bacteroidales bacterium]